jgi:phage-related protein
MIRIVKFYKTSDEYCPVQDFIEGLSGKAALKVTWTLALLEELEILPSTYFKKLVNTDGIWEVRISLGSNIYRVFCFFAGNSVVILTHGLVKKTQKTPPGEIDRAEAYKQDYLSRRS